MHFSLKFGQYNNGNNITLIQRFPLIYKCYLLQTSGIKFNYKHNILLHNINIVFNQVLSFPEGGEYELGWVGPRFFKRRNIAVKVSRACH